MAAKWEADLRGGRYAATSKVTWEDFRDGYENEVLAARTDGTGHKVDSVFNVIERVLSPQLLRDVTEPRIAYYQRILRTGDKDLEIEPRSEATIRSHMAHLKAALNWAVRKNWLAKVPSIEMPKRAKGQTVMKGRPITHEEFERMLDKVASIVSSEAVLPWQHLLEGLWRSGLRLQEALELSWDDDSRPCVDLAGRRPMLLIPVEHDKGNERRLTPIVPEFAELLEKISVADQTDGVFRPRLPNHQMPLRFDTISKTISAIGKTAGVKVNSGVGGGKPKFASARDLRRSFGARWATRVMPAGRSTAIDATRFDRDDHEVLCGPQRGVDSGHPLGRTRVGPKR